MQLEDAIKHAINGDAVLFLGSGASITSKSQNGENMCTADDLSKLLLSKFSINYSEKKIPPLDLVAQKLVSQNHCTELINYLKMIFYAGEIDHHIEVVSSLNWKSIFTTNYDNIFETAKRKSGQNIASFGPSVDPRSVNLTKQFIYHINGFIEQLDEIKLLNEFKLTRSSYWVESFSSNPWSNVFWHHIEESKAFIILGYSIYDLDIARIIYSSDRIKNKCIIITATDIDGFAEDALKELGTVLPIAIDGFSREIESIQREYIPVPRIDLPVFLRKESIASSLEGPTDTDLFQMFMEGIIQPGLIKHTQLNQEARPYVVERMAAQQIQNIIRSNTNSVIEIGAGLGNGKSVLLKQIIAKICDEYDVFSIPLDADIYNVSSDINNILRRNDRSSVIIFDGLLGQFKAFQKTVQTSAGRSTIIYADRTSNIMNLSYELERIVPQRHVFDLDALEKDEVDDVIKLVEYSPFIAGIGEGRKSILNHGRCYGGDYCFRNIVISLLNSKDIKNRIGAVFSKLSIEQKEVILASLILSVVGLSGQDINFVTQLVGREPRIVSTIDFRSQEAVRVIINLKNGLVPQSTVAAQFILKNIMSAADVCDVLVKIMTNSSKFRMYSSSDELCRALMINNNIQHVLPEEGKREAMISYYQRIKHLTVCRSNHDFWLQYAIARLFFEELDYAEKLFEIAYKCAADNNRPKRNIDNHYARLLFMKSITRNGIFNFSEISKACDIIKRQIENDSNSSYPYKVSKNLKELFENHHSKMGDGEKRKLITFANYVLTNAKGKEKIYCHNQDINRCIVAMNYVLTHYGN